MSRIARTNTLLKVAVVITGLLLGSTLLAQGVVQRKPTTLIAPFNKSSIEQSQRAWADFIKSGARMTNSLGISLVLVPPGQYSMGGTETVDELKKAFPFLEHRIAQVKLLAIVLESERPAHAVKITRLFYLGDSNVTVEQFSEFIRDSGYKTDAEQNGEGGWGYDPGNKGKPFLRKPEYTWRHTGFVQSLDHPVVNVSWNDAVAFCEWISKKESHTYRLPTEAEWEYSCRAGTTSRYCNGENPEELVKVANVADSSLAKRFGIPASNGASIRADDGFAFTSPVRHFAPNSFGLYDMHGNAGSWCSDWYAADYYKKSPEKDPGGPPSGSFRVFRGEGWHDTPVGCRCASRAFESAANCSLFCGFRVVREP